MFTLHSKNRNLSLKLILNISHSEYLYFPDSSEKPSLGNALAGNFPLELSPMLKFLQKLKYLSSNSFPRMVRIPVYHHLFPTPNKRWYKQDVLLYW